MCCWRGRVVVKHRCWLLVMMESALPAREQNDRISSWAEMKNVALRTHCRWSWTYITPIDWRVTTSCISVEVGVARAAPSSMRSVHRARTAEFGAAHRLNLELRCETLISSMSIFMNKSSVKTFLAQTQGAAVRLGEQCWKCWWWWR